MQQQNGEEPMRVLKTIIFAVFAFAAIAAHAPQSARAASAAAIDADARATLNQFFARVVNGRDLANKAEAILISYFDCAFTSKAPGLRYKNKMESTSTFN